MSILDKLLHKRGIEKIDDLTPEEQKTFEAYKVILSGDAITVAQIKDFCKTQISLIETKCDGIIPLTQVQQACLHVYINILKAIEAPEAEREQLEKHLSQLVNS